MAFKAIVTTEVEFCSMCPFGGIIEHYNTRVPCDAIDMHCSIDIHCSKLHRIVHTNLEKLECCATGSSLTAEDTVPGDCPFPLDCDTCTITGSGDYTQTNLSHK